MQATRAAALQGGSPALSGGHRPSGARRASLPQPSRPSGPQRSHLTVPDPRSRRRRWGRLPTPPPQRGAGRSRPGSDC